MRNQLLGGIEGLFQSGIVGKRLLVHALPFCNTLLGGLHSALERGDDLVPPPVSREQNGEPDHGGYGDARHDGDEHHQTVHVLEHVLLHVGSWYFCLVRVGQVALARKPRLELRLVEALAHVLAVAGGDRGEANEAVHDPGDGEDGCGDVVTCDVKRPHVLEVARNGNLVLALGPHDGGVHDHLEQQFDHHLDEHVWHVERDARLVADREHESVPLHQDLDDGRADDGHELGNDGLVRVTHPHDPLKPQIVALQRLLLP